MKKVVFVISSFFLCLTMTAQESKPQPVKVPAFILPNRFTNAETYKLLRWVVWSKEQKEKIFVYAKELEQAGELSKEEIILKVQNFLNTTITEEQKKGYAEKLKNAAALTASVAKLLEEFEKEIKTLNGTEVNEDLLDFLSSTPYFYYPQVWALTHTPLAEEDYNVLKEVMSHLTQVEQGFSLADDKAIERLNDNKHYLDFSMKKDYGTEILLQATKKFTKPTQEIFNNLLKLYEKQKKRTLELYKQYSDKINFEISMIPPKYIIDGRYIDPLQKK